MAKIRWDIIRAWNTEITDEKGEKKPVIGISFMYSNNNTIYTLFIDSKKANKKHIAKCIEDYYKTLEKKHKLESEIGEFEIE